MVIVSLFSSCFIKSKGCVIICNTVLQHLIKSCANIKVQSGQNKRNCHSFIVWQKLCRVYKKRLKKSPWTCVWVLVLPVALSPLVFIPTGADENIGKCAYVGLLMALCWMLELMPLAVTALLPVALFPILGVASTAYVSVQYLNKTCMLFVGGKSNK